MCARLPRPDELIVERRKIVDYLLCAAHSDGATKAKFFASLGFHVKTWQILADALARHGREREIVSETSTPFGQKFVVRFDIVSPNGRNPCIDSIWITEEDVAPRLVTADPRS